MYLFFNDSVSSPGCAVSGGWLVGWLVGWLASEGVENGAEGRCRAVG